MQMEIDDLQRNCDVFNEQMNDAVERAMELQLKIKQTRRNGYKNICQPIGNKMLVILFSNDKVE